MLIFPLYLLKIFISYFRILFQIRPKSEPLYLSPFWVPNRLSESVRNKTATLISDACGFIPFFLFSFALIRDSPMLTQDSRNVCPSEALFQQGSVSSGLSKSWLAVNCEKCQGGFVFRIPHKSEIHLLSFLSWQSQNCRIPHFPTQFLWEASEHISNPLLCRKHRFRKL